LCNIQFINSHLLLFLLQRLHSLYLSAAVKHQSVLLLSLISEHLAITGRGTLDGNGLEWWRNSKNFRPHLVQFNHVNNALLSDTLYLNAPNHVLELYCNNCELSGVKVLSPPSTGQCEKDKTCSHNTDAGKKLFFYEFCFAFYFQCSGSVRQILLFFLISFSDVLISKLQTYFFLSP